MDEINTDLSKYCDSMLIDFVTGARPLTEWNAYQEQLEQMGSGELLDIYQAAIDRYHALVTATR